MTDKNSYRNITDKSAAFNVWANRRIIDWLDKQDFSLLEEPVPSSFSGIKATLSHILCAEDEWYERLHKNNGRIVYGETYAGSMEELFKELIDQSKKIFSYVLELPETELVEKQQYDIAGVGSFDHTRQEMIQHCINHSTYHRGQIVTMARGLGITEGIPMIDFLMFA